MTNEINVEKRNLIAYLKGMICRSIPNYEPNVEKHQNKVSHPAFMKGYGSPLPGTRWADDSKIITYLHILYLRLKNGGQTQKHHLGSWLDDRNFLESCQEFDYMKFVERIQEDLGVAESNYMRRAESLDEVA